MAVWWQALILHCCLLLCAVSPAPISQRNKYTVSFSLTRSTRTQVQQLNRKYKEQQFGDVHFEDRSKELKELPLLSTDVESWLNLTEQERLNAAMTDMQIFWNMLERKRQQLELEGEHSTGPVRHVSLPESIALIQLELRDLMSQVSSQLSRVRSSWTEPPPPTAAVPQRPQASSEKDWDSRVEGYIILRDLDLYLVKLARDFLVLALQTDANQH
ncbi:uncharacterized protein LOC142884627 [Nelusetta ayraudi]|uniref:uncharacterized protein LOC142884627 n=1 Tax=Nelusetta ayraudi TaxID=303726 RepID=UPI003F70FBBF